MTKVTEDDVQYAREKVFDAETLEDWKEAAKVNLFTVERLWNVVRKLRSSEEKTRTKVNRNEDLEILKYRLKTLLKDNIVEVSFTNADGTMRDMKCTLKPTLVLDSAFLSADDRERSHTVPENVLPVWDLDKNAWRSFRIDRVHDYMVKGRE